MTTKSQAKLERRKSHVAEECGGNRRTRRASGPPTPPRCQLVPRSLGLELSEGALQFVTRCSRTSWGGSRQYWRQARRRWRSRKDGRSTPAILPMGSSVVSGSKEIMRTVWSSQPTACVITVSHPLTKSTSDIPRRVSSGDHPEPHRRSMPRPYFPSPSCPGIRSTVPPDPVRSKPVPRSSGRPQSAVVRSDRDDCFPWGTLHSLTLRFEETCRIPRGWTWRRVSVPSAV